jgi:chromate transporter
MEISRLFLRLGATAFGGPAAHVAVMETECVDRRSWISRAAFLDTLGVVQLLPGPNSTELAIHLGHARAGWRGGVLAGLSFLLPSVVLVWVLASVANVPKLAPIMIGVLWWLAPVVVAVLLDALWKFGRQSSQRPAAIPLFALTGIAAFALTSELWILVIGAVASVLLVRGRSRTAVMCVAALLSTVAAADLLANGASGHLDHVTPSVTSILLYFLRVGVSVFGSGYVLFGYLQHDLVTTRGWLSSQELMQAAALAQVTPGPLFATATAAGYFVGGHVGALMATVGIFAPAFFSVVLGSPLRRWVERSRSARAALDGVVIAGVALLGRAVVGFAWPMVAWQWPIAIGAVALLFSRRLAATSLLFGAAAVGVALALFHSSGP